MRAFTHTPFALSLSKGCPSLLSGRSAGLRQAQPERFWIGLGSAFALAACQSGAPANTAAPADPLAVAERLVRSRVEQHGALRFVEARVRSNQGVTVVCGAYEQGGRQQRYILVDGQDVFVEPEMAAGEMPRAVNEFCAEGGRA